MTTSHSATAGSIRTEIDGAIGRLIIDNPSRRNALTLAMWQEIPDAIARLDTAAQVRAIVVTGAGIQSFSAGADISEFERSLSTPALAKESEAINIAAFRAVKHTAKPTIAMIRGHCFGGGIGIALACDLRIAEAGSRFAIPPAKLGLAYPPEALDDLVIALGPMATKHLLFTAAAIEVGEALRIGLIMDIAEKEVLEDKVEALCASIAANAPLSQQAAKLAINALAGSSMSSGGFAAARAAADACFESRDLAEGRDAFLEKRKPVFTGQ